LSDGFSKVVVLVGDFSFRTCVDVDLDEVCDEKDCDLGENCDCGVRDERSVRVVPVLCGKVLDELEGDFLDSSLECLVVVELVCYLYRCDVLLSL
jgi:hypothetical protein